MRTPDNLFKQALARGETQIGLWLALADAYAAELCAGSGFDWLLIDGEHAPNDLRSTLACLQAVAAYPVHPVVRLPQGDTALIKQVLDLGASTLLVPMVESAEQARSLVRAMRYPPQGVRGVGSAIARSSRWARHADYRHDLAASMGHLGQPAHPEVRAAIEAAIARIRAQGKPAGVLASDEAFARRCLALGAQFVAVGVDTSLLVRATTQLAAAFKGGPQTASPAPRAY